MDTSMLLDLLHENDQFTIKLIQDFASGKKINFIILDIILTEWTNIEHKKYHPFKKISHRRNQLTHALHQFGAVTEIPTWYDSDEWVWAEKKYNSKKYVKPVSRETLSRTDCVLLKFALDNPWTLVTLDHLLIRAYCTEIEILGLNKNILVPEDWVWEDNQQ
jgi:hypothetical protein